MASCRKADARREAEFLGFHFPPANSEKKKSNSYFSTLQYITEYRKLNGKKHMPHIIYPSFESVP